MMTNNSNDVIAPTAQAATAAVTFPSPQSGSFFSLSSLLYRIVVGVVVFVGVLAMLKSLHLAGICTLMSVFRLLLQIISHVFCYCLGSIC